MGHFTDQKPIKDQPLIKDQEPPVPNQNPAIWELVIQDMRDRDKIGLERYKTHLQAFNGRNALIDAYQEALDLVVYLRQEIEERMYYEEEILGLQKMVSGLSERVAKQSELLSKSAERVNT